MDDVLNSEMISYPLTRDQICTMSDGAAVAVLCTEERAKEFTDRPIRVTGVGTGTDTMRLADRPFGKVPLAPNEKESDYTHLQYPGIHSFRAGRAAGLEAYKMAGITDPKRELDFVELHDAYASSEIQTYEDLALCRYGEGYGFVETGAPFLKGVQYPFPVPKAGEIPVNPSGGLIACGHPVGATGLMQAVFAFWQLQETIGKHFRDPTLQIPNARRGRHPQPRGDRVGGDRLDPRAGVLRMTKPKTFTKFRDVQAEILKSGSAIFKDADGFESLILRLPVLDPVHPQLRRGHAVLPRPRRRPARGIALHVEELRVRLRHPPGPLHGLCEPHRVDGPPDEGEDPLVDHLSLRERGVPQGDAVQPRAGGVRGRRAASFSRD